MLQIKYTIICLLIGIGLIYLAAFSFAESNDHGLSYMEQTFLGATGIASILGDIALLFYVLITSGRD